MALWAGGGGDLGNKLTKLTIRDLKLHPNVDWSKVGAIESMKGDGLGDTLCDTCIPPPPTVDPVLLIFSPGAKALGLLNGTRSLIFECRNML